MVMTRARVNVVKRDKAWVIGTAAFPNPKAKIRSAAGKRLEVKVRSTAASGSTASKAAAKMRTTRESRKLWVKKRETSMLAVYFSYG